MERHSETFLASPHLADTVGAGRKRVHFNSSDQAQRSNDATSTGPDTENNVLEAPFSEKSATDQSSSQSSDDARSSSNADICDRLRPLVSSIRAVHQQEVSELVDGIKPEDAQDLADVLSAVLSQEEGILARDEGNRILVVLCKLATRFQVYPQRYTLKGVKYDHKTIKGGGFGFVYDGQYKNRAVCVKVIKDENNLSAYIKELMIWAHLSHSNILPLYGVYQNSEGPRICLVSPRMKNGTLAEYAKGLPKASRMLLISGVIDGLLYLHGLHIVHGDLKGENVLVSDEGEALIMDFGISHIATATAGQKRTTSIIGRSLHWTAPEIIENEDSTRPTEPSDVWSFACLCYEVLSRKIPFHTLGDPQVIRALDAKKIPPRPEPGQDDWDEIDDNMWRLMTHCWRYKPKDRPTTQDIHDRFAMLLSSNGLTSQRIQRKPPVRSPSVWASALTGTVSVVKAAWDTINSGKGARGDATVTAHTRSSTSNSGSNPPARSSSAWASSTTETIHAIKTLRNDDIIIAFMGPTGSGKSFFIDLLTDQLGRRTQRAGNGLKSVTSQIQATRAQHKHYGDRIVLIDTPGFDDTTRSDMEILTMISDWLKKTYESDIKLSGLIYLHRITDNRMAGTPLKNLRMFGELCGDVAMSQVILVSNMWQKVRPEVGVAREEELRSRFWKPLVEKGSRVERLTDARGSEAWRIVEQLILRKDEREAVLLQEELVELEKRLNETQAGKTLYTTLQKALDDQRESLKALLAQVENSNDPALRKELMKEYEKINKEFQKTFEEVKKLKIPLGRRIKAFFFGKRARAKAIKVVDSA